MKVWLGLHHKHDDLPILVNIDLVQHVSLNNPKDALQGAVLHFNNEHYIIVRETYDEIHFRLTRALT